MHDCAHQCSSKPDWKGNLDACMCVKAGMPMDYTSARCVVTLQVDLDAYLIGVSTTIDTTSSV